MIVRNKDYMISFKRKKYDCPSCGNLFSPVFIRNDKCKHCGVRLEVDSVTNTISSVGTLLFLSICYFISKNFMSGINSFDEVSHNFWIYIGLNFVLYGVFEFIYIPYRKKFLVK